MKLLIWKLCLFTFCKNIKKVSCLFILPLPVCGGHLKATGAVQKIFSHSRYGDANYENKEDCDWIIEAPSGQNVHLSFLSFEMEDEQDCGYDYIEVFSGYDDAGPSYGRFCGNKVSQN